MTSTCSPDGSPSGSTPADTETTPDLARVRSVRDGCAFYRISVPIHVRDQAEQLLDGLVLHVDVRCSCDCKRRARAATAHSFSDDSSEGRGLISVSSSSSAGSSAGCGCANDSGRSTAAGCRGPSGKQPSLPWQQQQPRCSSDGCLPLASAAHGSPRLWAVQAGWRLPSLSCPR